MKISSITLSGWKGQRGRFQLGDVNVIVGPNGAGKTALYQAIEALTTGDTRFGAPGGRGHDRVLLLAEPGRDKLALSSEWTDDAGEVLTLARRWSRRRYDKVSKTTGEVTPVCQITETLDGSLVSRAEGTEARSALVGLTLGAMAQVWSPDQLLEESGSKARRALVRLLGARGLPLAEYVPPDAPAWAAPLASDTVDEWIARVLSEARRRANEEAQALQLAEAKLVETPFASGQDPAPVQARLVALRGELAAADDATRRRARLAEIERLPRARPVAEARADLDAAQARRDQAAAGAEKLRALAAAKAELAKLEAAVAALGSVRPATETDLAEAEGLLERARAIEADARADAKAARLEPLQAELGRVLARGKAVRAELDRLGEVEPAEDSGEERRAVAALEGELRALSGGLPIHRCPECGKDLRHAVAAAREAVERRLVVARGLADLAAAAAQAHALSTERQGLVARVGELRRAIAAAEAAEAAVGPAAQATREAAERRTRAADGVRVAGLRAQRATLAAEVERLERETNALPGLVDAASAVARVKEALVAAEAYERAQAEAAELRRALEAPTRARAEVEADISAAEAELVACGVSGERGQAWDFAKADVAQAQARAEVAKGWLDCFQRREVAILDAIKARVEGPVSRVLGREVRLELADGRGNPACRWTIGGVDAVTFSDGERMRFLRGLLVALAPHSGARWRPIFCDRLESVSADARPAFVQSMVEAVKSGEISQAFLFGCLDSAPQIEGVTVIDLSQPRASVVLDEGPVEAPSEPAHRDLADGESVEVQGTAAKPYILKNVGGVYSCTCPAWTRQKTAHPDRRTCKHIRGLRGDAAEDARCAAPLPRSGPPDGYHPGYGTYRPGMDLAGD